MNNQEVIEYTSSNIAVKLKPETSKKTGAIKHSVINSEKEFDELKTGWNLLCERTNSYVFQTYEWNRTWWDHFGARGELQIFALYDGEILVGIAPLFFDRIAIAGMKPYTCLRMIGSQISTTEEGTLLGFKPYSDYLQFLIEKDYLKSFYKHLTYFLTNEIYFDELVLEEVPENSTTLSILNHDFSSNGYEVSICNASRSYNVLPEESWEDYLKNLTANERNNVRRCQKRIRNSRKKLFRTEEFRLTGDIKKTLRRFIELHQKQWNSKGLPGSFAETCMHQFFMDVSQKLYENGYLKINTIQPEDTFGLEHCLAMDINLEYKDRVYSQHRAMDINSPKFSKGPGKALLTDVIKDAVQSRKTFDFLRGEEKYKERLATYIHQNKTVRISVSSGYRKWTGLILAALHRFHKKMAVESVRFKVLKDQSESGLAFTRYIRTLFKRITKRFELI